MTRPASPLFSQDLLVEPGRVGRPPLRKWARYLLDKLESGVSSPDPWPNVSGCLNNASLIDVYRGNLQGARELCELQLQCATNLISFHDPAAHAGLVVQPWINLGRLLRIQRQFDRALESFSILFDALRGLVPHSWPLDIDAPTWRRHVEARNARPVMSLCMTVFIIDSIKTYFSAADLPGAMRFLQQARSLPDSDAYLSLDESELLTLAWQGRYDEAWVLTERPGWRRDSYTRLVRVTYRLLLTTAAGDLTAARQSGRQLAERVLQWDWSAPGDQRLLRYLHQLGKVLHHLELHDLARSIWHAGLRGSHHFEDVPLQLSFLESLLALGGPDLEALEAERATLLAECLYLPLLKSRGIETTPLALQDPLFDELRGQLIAVVESSASSRSCDLTA